MGLPIQATVSLGTDIVDIMRIRRMVKNKRFLNRVFTSEEVAYCADKKNSAQHYAVRFAAKEAVWKALSGRTSLRGIGHKEISVTRDRDGKPGIKFSARLARYQSGISLSLSHTKDYALAVALYQGRS